MSYQDDPTDPDEHEELRDYSSNGLCPMCGAELEELVAESWQGGHKTVYIVSVTQYCPSCGWESVPLYDAS